MATSKKKKKNNLQCPARRLHLHPTVYNPAVIFWGAWGILVIEMEVIQCKTLYPGYQSPALTVQWLPWEQTDILREMLKALLLCVCQLGDRTGSSACTKWKICHIVSKLCSGRAPSLLVLPSPLRSSVWSCVGFCQSQLPPRGVEHENTHTDIRKKKQKGIWFHWQAD